MEVEYFWRISFSAPNSEQWTASCDDAGGVGMSTDNTLPEATTCFVIFRRGKSVRTVGDAPFTWKEPEVLNSLFARARPLACPELIYYNDALIPLPADALPSNTSFIGRWRSVAFTAGWMRNLSGDDDSQEGPYHFFAYRVAVDGATVGVLWARRDDAEDPKLISRLAEWFDAVADEIQVAPET